MREKNKSKPLRNTKWLRMRRADLMSHTSNAEKSAYNALCKLGYEVIKQYPINTGRRIYFADLYIPALKLILEVDGNYHLEDNQKRLDRNRSSGLWRLGYHVLRLKNKDCYDIKKIHNKINLIEKH